MQRDTLATGWIQEVRPVGELEMMLRSERGYWRLVVPFREGCLKGGSAPEQLDPRSSLGYSDTQERRLG